MPNSETDVIVNDVTSEELNNKIGELIEVLTDEEQLQLEAENLEQTKELIETMSTNIETLNTTFGQGSEGQLLEYQEIKSTLVEVSNYLEQLNETANASGDFIEIASNAVVTYSIFYIPLAVIIYCGWWFFNQFLTDFR